MEEYLGIRINLERDKLFDELGIKRLQESYMHEGEESPQHRFAYIADIDRKSTRLNSSH